MVIDGVDEPNPNMGMVIGDQDNVEELLTLRVEFTQLSIHCLQGLVRHTEWNQSWNLVTGVLTNCQFIKSVWLYSTLSYAQLFTDFTLPAETLSKFDHITPCQRTMHTESFQTLLKFSSFCHVSDSS